MLVSSKLYNRNAAALLAKKNGYLRVDCYGGLNQMRRDVSNMYLFASKEPVRVDCSKRKGSFDYVETVLPSLLEHHYISITSAMSQRRDRHPLYAKAALCQACHYALRLTTSQKKKDSELLEAIPKPFLSLQLRFEPDMGLNGKLLMDALWRVHRDDCVMGVGSALPDCFCE
ncbi:hypothetical protein BUALT_Bualt07G0132500 [Buddleja alternifolia]|uniref:Uncharacterized protein n=1 Tax=Buddleja alternifolia TaxID=168488 RepID=A0AAV6XHF6_9LAMI|nr:hypothetical protein BUALT_Bualt07G0132500 [Buddleja alternifolia]